MLKIKMQLNENHEKAKIEIPNKSKIMKILKNVKRLKS